MLPKRNPFFTGQEDTLNDIYHYFLQSQTDHHAAPTIYWLEGPSGIGKTQIALEYAHRHHNNYQTIFWIRASSLSLAEIDLQQILQEGGPLPYTLPLIHTWLENHSDWLVIFDGMTQETQQLLPTHGSGEVIVTSIESW